MTGADWRRLVAPSVVIPLAGLGLALGMLAVADDRDLPGSVTAYALAALPVSAFLSAVAARLGGRPRLAGAVTALASALVAAQFSAMIRFYLAGARGFWSLAAAPYTAEVLMLLGSVPIVAWLGAKVAGARWDRGRGAGLGLAGLVGAGLSPLLGLGLIAARFAARIPFFDPVVQWLAVVVVASLVVGIGRAPGADPRG